jgi:hypothetical protein
VRGTLQQKDIVVLGGTRSATTLLGMADKTENDNYTLVIGVTGSPCCGGTAQTDHRPLVPLHQETQHNLLQ